MRRLGGPGHVAAGGLSHGQTRHHPPPDRLLWDAAPVHFQLSLRSVSHSRFIDFFKTIFSTSPNLSVTCLPLFAPVFRVAEFETFTQTCLSTFALSRNKIDRKTLVTILKQLQFLRERQQYSDEMFEPLQQSAKLLASYLIEVPENTLRMLQVWMLFFHQILIWILYWIIN